LIAAQQLPNPNLVTGAYGRIVRHVDAELRRCQEKYRVDVQHTMAMERLGLEVDSKMDDGGPSA
jgi:hypothetical protein